MPPVPRFLSTTFASPAWMMASREKSRGAVNSNGFGSPAAEDEAAKEEKSDEAEVRGPSSVEVDQAPSSHHSPETEEGAVRGRPKRRERARELT